MNCLYPELGTAIFGNDRCLRLADGNEPVYCHRTSRATLLASETEELERGDSQVGIVYCRGKMIIDPVL
jgi:hypothetical protein